MWPGALRAAPTRPRRSRPGSSSPSSRGVRPPHTPRRPPYCRLKKCLKVGMRKRGGNVLLYLRFHVLPGAQECASVEIWPCFHSTHSRKVCDLTVFL
uniref:Uncharacterized protein n=1 Tax=Taeniopygia guttata TaxID=59729 RepID=A0A674GNL3_TAEGU